MKSLLLVLSLAFSFSVLASNTLNQEQDRLDDEIVKSTDISSDLELIKLIK